MKNIYANILMGLLLCTVTVWAEPEIIPSTLNTTNPCGEPVGFINTYSISEKKWFDYIIVGAHPVSTGYYSTARIGSTGDVQYSIKRIYWTEYPAGSWKYVTGSSSSGSYSTCGQDFLDYVTSLTNEQRLDVETICNDYFPETPFDEMDSVDETLDGHGEGADPVSLINGEYTTSVTDVVIPAKGIPITITRTYGSLREYNGRFGYGWDLNYNMRVFEIVDGETVLLRDGRGDKYTYTTEDGTNRFTRSDRRNYIRSNGTAADYPYSLVKNNGLEYHFDEYGLLAVIEDRMGNTLTFSYESSGGVPVKSSITGGSDYFVSGFQGVVGKDYKLTTITDTLGRQVTLGYNGNGLLSTVTDFESRQWTYSYAWITNDLLTVTTPATTEYPNGLTITYAYNDSDYSHGLTSIYDGENDPAVNQSAVAYLENDYNSDGKVISQRYGPEQDTGDSSDLDNSEFIFDYADIDNDIVTVKSRKKIEDGNDVLHNSITQTTFNSQGQTTSEIVSTDTGATNPASYETTYTYTANQEIETAQLPKGNGVYYDYDSHGHIKTMTLLDDVDTPTETITSQFEFSNDMLVSATDPKGNQTHYVYALGMEFNGSTDYINLPVDTLENITDKFSISLWFNADDLSGYMDLISIGADTAYDAGANLAVHSGGIYYHVSDDASASSTGANFAATVGIDEWHHLVLTVTQSAVTGYLDGEQFDPDTLSFTGDFTNSQLDTHSIGKAVKYNDFSGVIDNVMIFDDELTEEDIYELYNDGAGMDKAGYLASSCIASWKLDDKAANTIVTDQTGNYNGTAYQNTENISCQGKVAGPFLHEIILPETTVAAWSGSTLQTSLSQPVTSFTYYDDDPNDIKYGLVETMTDPNGLVVEYQYYDDTDTYDTNLPQNGNYGRLKKTIIDPDTEAITTEYKYDALGHVSWVKDADNNVSESVSNALDQLITAVAPVLSGESTGYETNLYYNKNGKLEKSERDFTDGDSTTQTQKIEYEYNLLDALKLVRDSLGYETESFYDDNENPIATQDAESKAQSVGNEYYTYMLYDERDLLSDAIDAEGNVTSYDYDDNGNLLTITDANDQTTTYTYDDFDRLIETEYPDTSTEEVGYDVSGNIVWTKTRIGDEFYYDFDALGRLSRKIIDNANSIQIDDTPSVTSGTWSEPNLLGQYSDNCLASTTASETCQFSFSVTAGDYIVYLWWPNGDTTTAADNAAVNLNDTSTTTVYVDQSTIPAQWHKLGTFTFGSTATIEVQSQGSGNTTYADAVRLVPAGLSVTEYFYDITGRILQIDENSNLTDYHYDSLGRLNETLDQNNRQIEYQHDDLNRRTRLAYPDGTFIEYVYDEMSRLTDIKYDNDPCDANSPVILAHYVYDELSRRTALYYNYNENSSYNDPNVDGYITYDYEDKTTDPATDNNLSNRLHYIDQDIDNDGTIDLTAAYTYYKVGNVKTKSLDGGDPHEYLYDLIYRLTEDEDTQTNGDKYNWIYNAVGNWLQLELNDTTQTEFSTWNSTDTTENSLNQYSSVGPTGNRVDYTYDTNGNLTDDGSYEYTYDTENRLLSVEFGESLCEYTYDAAGRRISKKIIDTTGPTLTAYTEYAYNGNQVVAEYDDNDLDGDVDYLARKFVYGPGIDEPICMIVYNTSGTETDRYFYHFDALGSVIALSQYDSGNGHASIVEQYEYSAFGETTVTLDGSTDNPYRFTGRRWDDETGLYYYRARIYVPELGRFLQPDPIGYADSINIYVYGVNNPLRFVDPLGLASVALYEWNNGSSFKETKALNGGGTNISDNFDFRRSASEQDYAIPVTSSGDAFAALQALVESGVEIDDLYIFGHGSSGNQQFAGGMLQSITASGEPGSDWLTLVSFVEADGEVHLRGCNVAQGETGQIYIETLARYGQIKVDAYDYYVSHGESILNWFTDNYFSKGSLWQSNKGCKSERIVGPGSYYNRNAY